MVEKITFTDRMEKLNTELESIKANPPSEQQRKKNKRNNWLILLVLFCFLAYGCVDLLTTSDEELAEKESQASIKAAEELEDLREADEQAALAHAAANTAESNIPGYDSSLAKDYEIIFIEDDNRMDAIRKQYWIVVPSDISETEAKATFIQLIMDETSKNPDIDAICIFAYDREVDVGYAYTIGTVDWCPDGEWNVPNEIARSNDRSSYEYVFTLTKRVVNSTLTKPTELEFEIYDFYKISYDAAWDEVDLSDPYATVDEDLVKQNVANHYGITAEEAYDIYRKVTEYQYQ
ncbi:hypothetical protein MettiDRAFT_2370 [Methanolobus tindarius DSM 2278]|uniref:Uncharacterized protein n=1 Tax=Methanolobus tindarius DSM 2278 TaxID=1090322 RepID=W9DYT6_METTI|nr:hypothetical protein [Methanolobus tindarius]ETA68882.1 hypothetical protein MettiDRAFT_2370 [Methanolobus tindarius DSM 2278]